MARKYKILALIGDGIAEEIVPEAVNALRGAEEPTTSTWRSSGPSGSGPSTTSRLG